MEDVGTRFGKWTVLEDAGYRVYPSGKRSALIRCRCDCGVVKDVLQTSLRSGKSTCCGCGKIYEDRSKPAFNQLFNHAYKGAAVKRGLTFDLTEEQFRELVSRECFYCGAPPTEFRRVSGTMVSVCLANGIDRVDNAIGYVLDNVVPCCFDCNHAKATLTQEQFLALARKIAEKHP